MGFCGADLAFQLSDAIVEMIFGLADSAFFIADFLECGGVFACRFCRDGARVCIIARAIGSGTL